MSKKDKLQVKKILLEFESESADQRRKGAFKIDAHFEEAINRILKAKPVQKQGRRKTDARRNQSAPDKRNK